MRLYGKKFARSFVESQVQLRAETRDAVLWDLDSESNTCRVKIQGSNQPIMAHYPRNWKKKPYWLKPGNAVRILHRTGVRGYIEVIGEGRAIPTPIDDLTGLPGTLPPPPSLPNMILAGLEVTPTDPETMGVVVSSGVYRIAEVVYTYAGDAVAEPIIMNDPAPMIMGEAVIMMGRTYTTVEIDAAPSVGYFRYDALVIGIDGEIQYLKGTQAKTRPAFPFIPSDTLQVGDFIFVRGGATAIYREDLGARYYTQLPTYIEVTTQYPNGFPWSGSSDTPEMWVKVTFRDQYGIAISVASKPVVTMRLKQGIGHIYSASSGYTDDWVSQSVTSSYNFAYRRNQIGEEISPVILEFTVSQFDYMYNMETIKLLGVTGEEITQELEEV